MERSGIVTEFRRCPRRGRPLEVSVVDEYNAPTYLKWWCEECAGYWGESYFWMQVEAALPIMGLVRKFEFICPRCGSPRLHRACNFDCCDHHRCLDCQDYFEIDYAILKRSNLGDAEIAELKATIWLDDVGLISWSSDPRFDHHSEASVISPCCEEHPTLR